MCGRAMGELYLDRECVCGRAMGDDCIHRLERLGRGADEEAIGKALRDADGLLKRCQPVQRAATCMRVGDWLSSKAMTTLGECPCWEPVPPPMLSLILYLVSQSLVFYLRAKAEAVRADCWWQQVDDPELRIRRLFSWALHESRSLSMPALHVCILRCICNCFARSPNVNMYKSECGAEAHLMLANLIFKGHADVSVAAKTEISQVAGSSNIKGMDLDMKLPVSVIVVGVDGSSNTEGMDLKRASSVNVTSGVVDVDRSTKSKGLNASYVKDVDPHKMEDMETKRASCVYCFRKKALDSHPHEEDCDMKRASELEECLRILEMAKELVPSDASLLKWKTSLLCAQIELAAFLLCPKLFLHQKIKLPFVSENSGEQDERVFGNMFKRASNVFSNMLGNQIVPLLKGKHWLYIAHIGITMSLLFH